jgi:hypothetical protein
MKDYIIGKLLEKTTIIGAVSFVMQALHYAPSQQLSDQIINIVWGVVNAALIVYSEKKSK